MNHQQEVGHLIGSTAFDSDGDKIGTVGQAYFNGTTGDAEWITIHTGLFGTRESFAPLHGSQVGDGELRLAVTKQQVSDAPHVDSEGQLKSADAEALYQHYAGYTSRDGSGAGT